MNLLPQETTAAIAAFLNPDDLYNLGLTCRGLYYHLLRNNYGLQQVLDVSWLLDYLPPYSPDLSGRLTLRSQPMVLMIPSRLMPRQVLKLKMPVWMVSMLGD